MVKKCTCGKPTKPQWIIGRLPYCNHCIYEAWKFTQDVYKMEKFKMADEIFQEVKPA